MVCCTVVSTCHIDTTVIQQVRDQSPQWQSIQAIYLHYSQLADPITTTESLVTHLCSSSLNNLLIVKNYNASVEINRQAVLLEITLADKIWLGEWSGIYCFSTQFMHSKLFLVQVSFFKSTHTQINLTDEDQSTDGPLTHPRWLVTFCCG